MTLEEAKKINIGDKVKLKGCIGTFEITDIESGIQEGFCFRSDGVYIHYHEITEVVTQKTHDNHVSYENCEFFKQEDVSFYHADVFDHPSYKCFCIKSGKKKELLLPETQCKRCLEKQRSGRED